MLDSEYRTTDHVRRICQQIGTRPNRYLDSEAMSVCAAIMLKLVGGERPKLRWMGVRKYLD